MRGWAALSVASIFTASGIGFVVYLLPLAHAAGLDGSTGGLALAALLAGQVAGSIFATMLAGRADYRKILWACALAYACTWPVYDMRPAAWLFVLASGTNGIVTFLAVPFLYALCADADPSRHTAAQSGPAQMLGVTIGPFLASFAMDAGGPRALIAASGALLLAAMTVVALTNRGSQPAVAFEHDHTKLQ